MANEPKEPQATFMSSDWASVQNVRRFSHRAMATTFEVIVQHEDELYARQAARAAFDEVDRLEGELSRFIENSDVARINALCAGQPLPLSLDTFECLRISSQMHDETAGTFDVTVGFLVDCWRDKDKNPRTPSPEELEYAREHTGMDLILFDEPTHAVALLASPVRVDLGGVGKGYAVDRMADLLREWSIDRALIHGGFSSVLALDAPQGADGWPVTLSHPNDRSRTLAHLSLERVSVSASGLEKGQHIVDPRVGRPVTGKLAVWSMAPDATRADCLSTAFMVMTPQEVKDYCAGHSEVRGLLIMPGGDASGVAQHVISAGTWREGELVM